MGPIWRSRAAKPEALHAEPVDICLIVEGAYPYVSGGLSTWIDNLIRRHSSLTFTVVAILPQLTAITSCRDPSLPEDPRFFLTLRLCSAFR